jgi:hypothetical protein
MSKPHGQGPCNRCMAIYELPVTREIAIARLCLFFACFVLLAHTAFANKPLAPNAVLFPPEDCSEADAGAVMWKDGDTATRCASPQDLLKLALPGCKAGQHIVFDGKAFICDGAASSAAKDQR